MRRLLLHIIQWLTKLTYKPVLLDNINKKMIKTVPGLIIDGKQYYEFVAVADIPQNRFVHYLDFRQESQMGVTRELANQYLENIKVANNNGDASNIGAYVYMLQDTINNCTPIEVLYNMASLLYFSSDEDLSCYDLDYNSAKIERFKVLQNKSFFFHHLLSESLKITGKQLPDNIDQYLKESMVKLNVYRQMLTSVQDETIESDLS